ncbi:2-C-methyl-D-erythritol 2,4-cyclodiphosphate synthase [Chloroflexota bacterium]
MRTGIGLDVHHFAAGRRLVLGGIEIPFAKGLSGWSDADVLTHAIIDALLGAATLGDIGRHFPPGDPHYQDISSLNLLAKVKDELAEKRFTIINIDATIVTEQPKLSDFIDRMRERLNETLGISINQVSVKASTADRLGFVGRGEGIAALAIALIEGGK